MRRKSAAPASARPNGTVSEIETNKNMNPIYNPAPPAASKPATFLADKIALLRESARDLMACFCERISELECEREELTERLEAALEKSEARRDLVLALEYENLHLHVGQVTDEQTLRNLAGDKADLMRENARLSDENLSLALELDHFRALAQHNPADLRRIAHELARQNLQQSRLDRIAGVAAQTPAALRCLRAGQLN